MVDFPTTLDEAIAQAQLATQSALEAGYTRLQVEIAIPELKPMEPALAYLPVFEHHGAQLKVFFTDAGAAALARRDWAGTPYNIQSIDIQGTRQTTPVDQLVEPEDQAFVFVSPSAVEVGLVEQLANAAGDRPVVLFNPRLEDVSIVGIGFAARKLRERFLNTIEPCYYLKPLEGLAILRLYPSLWQVWAEVPEGYKRVAEEAKKPTLERLDEIMTATMGVKPTAAQGFFAEFQRMLRAIGR